jgi:hypothetical protein
VVPRRGSRQKKFLGEDLGACKRLVFLSEDAEDALGQAVWLAAKMGWFSDAHQM